MDKVLCHSVIADSGISTVDMLDPFEDGSGVILYKFDGDATDESGIYNLTSGTPNYTTGKFGQGLSNTATTAGIMYINSQLSALYLTNYTMSIWYKPSAIGALQYLFNNQERASGSGSIYNEGARISIATDGYVTAGYNVLNSESLTDSNGSSFTSYFIRARSSFPLIVGTMYHIVAVISGTNVKLYINGILNSQVTSSQTARWSAETLYYGKFSIGGLTYDTSTLVYPLNGVIDQPRLINRPITSDEVTILYNEEK